MNKVLAILTALLLVAVAAPATAAPARVDIVIAADNAPTAAFARAMRRALLRSTAIAAVSIRTQAELRTAEPGALAIAVGDAMLPWLFAPDNPYAAQLAFYVGAAEFERAGGAAPGVSAIYREQPLQRQLQLAKRLLPQLQRVAVIHRPGAGPDLDRLGRATGLTLNGAAVEADTHWAKTLSRLLGDNDMLLGLEDHALYNRDTIRSILLTAYRHGKVLIGPNQAFVTAGSLASCYTAPEQFLQQLRAAVEHYLERGALPAPAYPRRYRIAVNRQVAASLGLALPDPAALIDAMRGGQTQDGECGDGC